MLKKLFRTLLTIIGMVLGLLVGKLLLGLMNQVNDLSGIFSGILSRIIFLVILCILFGLIFFIISPMMYVGVLKVIDRTEKYMQKLSTAELIFGGIGAIIALIISALIGLPLNSMEPAMLGSTLYVLINIFAAIIGADIMMKKKDDISSMLSNIKKSPKDKKSKEKKSVRPKVLDTSVIIDGRIFDICQTEFVEGPLVIPSFVLDELRHISDSSDSLKRNRGRRGLDILNKMQKELSIEVQIWEGDFPEINEVDSKLLKLAQKLNGKVVTNDFNLNKVAEFQGVPVLNINELANAIKQVVIPGEEMRITVIKDGKESGQGIGYLDDGTMIVVEGGRKFIGEDIDVNVTSVLQTAAGRMIFAKQKE